MKRINWNAKNTIIQMSALLILGTLLFLLPLELSIWELGRPYYLIFLLGMGFFYLAVNAEKLMYVSLALCMGMAIILNNSLNSNLKFSSSKYEDCYSVLLLPLSNITEGETQMRGILDENQAEIVLLTELTPDWINLVNHQYLKDYYPYQHLDFALDHSGTALLSRLPFMTIDTIRTEGEKYFEIQLDLGNNRSIYTYSFNTGPEIDLLRSRNFSEQLDTLSSFIRRRNGPNLVMGDFQRVPWNDDLVSFRRECGLTDSRRGFEPTLSFSNNFTGNGNTHYIFHNQELNCQYAAPIVQNGRRIAFIASFYPTIEQTVSIQ